jgi:hypothetical protein
VRVTRSCACQFNVRLTVDTTVSRLVFPVAYRVKLICSVCVRMIRTGYDSDGSGDGRGGRSGGAGSKKTLSVQEQMVR